MVHPLAIGAFVLGAVSTLLFMYSLRQTQTQSTASTSDRAVEGDGLQLALSGLGLATPLVFNQSATLKVQASVGKPHSQKRDVTPLPEKVGSCNREKQQ